MQGLNLIQGKNISIHALREEGDIKCVGKFNISYEFLSTPSARRATPCPVDSVTLTEVFLSTPSARRATLPGWVVQYVRADFYPRPPRGGRRSTASG